MNNILTQNDGNNQLGIGSTQINILGITGNTLDITQGTTSFMSISNSFSSEKISVKKPTTLANNLLTIKSTAKIDNAATNSLFYIDDNSELKTLGIGTTDEYLRMGFNRPAWGPKTFVESNVSGIGSIGYLEELKIDDDKLIGIGTTLGVKSHSGAIIQYDTNNDTSLIMSNGVGVGTLTIKTKYDTNFFDITLKKVDSDFSSNAISKSLEIVDAKTYKYTIDDLSNNSIHYYKLDINDINSFTTSTKKFHHITLRRDSLGPTMTITSTTSGVTDGSTTNDATIVLKFEANETTTNFAVGDITVNNGTISNFASTSSTVYTATFTPDGSGARTKVCTIDVAGGAFTDASGNNNTAATQFNWTFDSLGPTMTITSTTSGVTDGSSTNDATIALTFTSSEPTINFASEDISVSNGSIGTTFASTSSTVYTATFTPSGAGACTIDVAANTFTDAAGNNNTAATQFNWTKLAVNPYGTTDLRYYMWEQNHSNFSGSRGTKGYSWIQTQRHDSRTGDTENPATDKNNFLYYETGSESDISGIVSGSPDAGTVNLLYAGNWRDTNYHGRWGFVYDDNTDIVDEHIWQFEYKGNDTYGNYYHIINTQVQYNYNNSSWQGPNHQIGNCLGPSSAANNTSMRATTSNGGEWYCYVNHVSGTSSPPKFTIKIYNNGSAPTHELYMYVSGNSYSYERMNWKYGSSYTVSSSDAENNMQNNFTMKFSITNLSYAEP